MMMDLLNQTDFVANVTSLTVGVMPKKLRKQENYLLYFILCVGIVGNIAALIILLHKDKRRNRKHLLMLRCLTINDLIAILLTTFQVIVHKRTQLSADRAAQPPEYLCYVYVLCRLFGIFSGCVALVMAGERWLALTRPFLYQKVTFPMIVRCMLLLWLCAIALTCMPFCGFGIWRRLNVNGTFDCIRYRDATEPLNVAYAYVWFFFGTLLCLSIVWCNLAVARALKHLGRKNGALRRISRASSRAKPLLAVTGSATAPHEVGVTPEEKAFAKLMAMLSISFLVCWMPQMISIPLTQYLVHTPDIGFRANKLILIFQKVADTLLGLHFTLDPYIYVLLRMPRPRFPLVKPLCRICWPARSRASSFTGTIEHHGSSGDPPTPITEAPSTPVSEAERDSQLVAVAV